MEAEEKRFGLRKADLAYLKRLELAFRTFLTMPDISPEDIVGLARAIRVVERLPLCTPDIDVSVSLDFRTENYVACSTVRLSPERIEAERSAASRLREGFEYESFPGFNMSVDLDGDYEIEGDKQEFFDAFLLQPDDLKSSGYGVSVCDDSGVEALPPHDH
jgi:hypothetical protein